MDRYTLTHSTCCARQTITNAKYGLAKEIITKKKRQQQQQKKRSIGFCQIINGNIDKHSSSSSRIKSGTNGKNKHTKMDREKRNRMKKRKNEQEAIPKTKTSAFDEPLNQFCDWSKIKQTVKCTMLSVISLFRTCRRIRMYTGYHTRIRSICLNICSVSTTNSSCPNKQRQRTFWC